MNKEEMLFPFDEIRPVQEDMMQRVADAIKKGRDFMAHAPTGLGKTIAALGPALKIAQEEDLTVFFLTSRHTQHTIALDTLDAIKKKYGLSIPVIDMIGKKHLCLQEGVQLLSSGEFSEYCKQVRENKQCQYYEKARDGNEFTMDAKVVGEDLIKLSPLRIDKHLEHCEQAGLCPYEMNLYLGQKARVIVADYYYIFNPSVSKSFMHKVKKELANCVIIVDEAHNLPGRIRELLSGRLSTTLLRNATKEANELEADECIPLINEIQENVLELLDLDGEKIVRKGGFKYSEEAPDIFLKWSDKIIEDKKRSNLGMIAKFLESYNEDVGFVNIVRSLHTDHGQRVELEHSCMDPSIISAPIFREAHSTILMSGTLRPISMYKNLLGFEGDGAEYPSPFPKKNKLSMIIPQTSTKYTDRSDANYRNIAKIIAEIADAVPGNSAAFFPSYYLRDQILPYLQSATAKTVIIEVPGMSKAEKEEMLDRFASYKDHGALLLGAASGSFGEGVDFAGDLLKCVIIVGLPLSKPDLYTQALIKYYDSKFGNGWDFGYTLPALSTVMQNAGRCIRSETDRGVVIYLDKRYLWENYRKAFTDDVKVSNEYVNDILEFFYSD